jgi:hypothetical protein
MPAWTNSLFVPANERVYDPWVSIGRKVLVFPPFATCAGIFAIWGLAACGGSSSSADAACGCQGDGLLVVGTFEDDPDCDFILGPNTYAAPEINGTEVDVSLLRCRDREHFFFSWPPTAADGDPGSITFSGNGDGFTIAEGMATLSVDTSTCVEVPVSVQYSVAAPDGGL